MNGPAAGPGYEAARARIESVEGDRRGGELQLRLSVQPGGRPAYEGWCRQQVPASFAAQLAPGQVVDVLIDLRDPRWVWLDLAGAGSAGRDEAHEQALAAYREQNARVPAKEWRPPPQVPPGWGPGRPGVPGPTGMPGPAWGTHDPRLAPVEGVTYELFVDLSAELLARPMAPAEAEQYLYGRGIPPGRWPVVQTGWNQRFGQFPDLGWRYQHDVEHRVRARTGLSGAPPPTAPPPWGGHRG